MASTAARFRPSGDVVARVLDGEAVLLDLRSGGYFGLNPVGSRIWELLVEGLATEAIAARLIDEFEVDLDVATRDLGELLQELERRGLITAEDG